MPPNTDQPSATPIIDLLWPLPTPGSEKINGRFALPFLTFVAIIVSTGNYSFLLVPFGFLAINFAATLIHELGHLIAGWSVGLRFIGVRVDPFEIRLDSGHWKFGLRPRLFWGYTFMKLDKVRRIRKRLVVCIMGGPLASISFGLLAVVGGEVGLARSDSGWPTVLGVWSLLLGFPGLFPHVARGFAMDGMMLRSLLFRKTEATQAIALHALMVPDNNALLSPDYYARWFRLASLAAPTDTGQYYANWLGYMTEVDNCKAAQLLESCLAQAAEIHRDKLIAEAVYFMGVSA